MGRTKKEIPVALCNSHFFKQTKTEFVVYTENLKLKGYEKCFYADAFAKDPKKKNGEKKLTGIYYKVIFGSPEQIALFEELKLTKHDELKD